MVRPTHVCKTCGAFWKLWADSWSLVSRECGKCCDNVAMEDQIELLEDFDKDGNRI